MRATGRPDVAVWREEIMRSAGRHLSRLVLVMAVACGVRDRVPGQAMEAGQASLEEATVRLRESARAISQELERVKACLSLYDQIFRMEAARGLCGIDDADMRLSVKGRELYESGCGEEVLRAVCDQHQRATKEFIDFVEQRALASGTWPSEDDRQSAMIDIAVARALYKQGPRQSYVLDRMARVLARANGGSQPVGAASPFRGHLARVIKAVPNEQFQVMMTLPGLPMGAKGAMPSAEFITEELFAVADPGGPVRPPEPGAGGQTPDTTGHPALTRRGEEPARAVAASAATAETVALFNGESLAGWQVVGDAGASGWSVGNGVLQNRFPGTDLVTEKRFADFDFHCEFKMPVGGNSGVYLRGRHEVQLADDAGGPAGPRGSGAVWGLLAPSENASLPAGQWQTLDVRLVGRIIDVTLNGKRVISGMPLEGPSHGALDDRLDEPGPILLQGKFGAVSFRNVCIMPVQSPAVGRLGIDSRGGQDGGSPTARLDTTPLVGQAYARESAFLAGFGGRAGEGGASPVDESEHLRFAAGASGQELMANLVSNYTAQFDRQLAMDVERAREFYAEASARLAAYEIDLGDPGSNLKNKGPHLVWAERHDASRMRQAIAEKVAALLRGAGASARGGLGDQPVPDAAPGARLPDSVAKPGHVDRIPSPDQGRVMFYVFQPGQSARFGVARPDGVIRWEKNAGIRPLVSYYWSEDSCQVVFLTECMQQEADLHCPKDVTSTWVFVLDAATGAVVGEGDLDRQVLDLKSRLPDALEASHSIESLRLADGWLEVTIGHRGQRVSGRCALVDLAPGTPRVAPGYGEPRPAR